MLLTTLMKFSEGKYYLSKLAIASSIVTINSLAIAPSQAINLIQNGSFESPLGLPDSNGISGSANGNSPFNVYDAPNLGEGIPGWNLVNGSVDVFTNFGSDGNQSIDTTGTNTGNGGLGPGTLEQSFMTTIGTLYSVSFDMGGGGLPSIKELEVSILDVNTPIFSQVFTLDVSATPLPNFQMEQFTFIASSTMSTIRFQSLIDQTFDGAILDNVSVEAINAETVPESSTIIGLLGLGMLGIGTTLKRKL